MSRKLLDSKRIHKTAAEHMSKHDDVIDEVERAIAKHDVVVVGMAQNPHVKRVRKILSEAKIEFEYLEYGSYFSEWRRRLTIKQWSGWATFPQVFVKGTLIGGADLTKAAIEDGTLKKLMAGKSAVEASVSN